MKILVLADQRSKSLYEYYEPEKLEGVELIISCGDLDPGYLSFFATVCHAPLIYVRGNHDEVYEDQPPEGCICIEDDIYVHKGIRIMGLGGSMQYIPRASNQYTEKAMKKRIRKMRWKLWRHKGFDILVAHAPAYQLNDGRDLPHQGFKIFRTLMEKYHPKYFLHGHVHMSYGRQHKRYDKYMDTHIINAYERCVFEFEDENPQDHIR